MNSEILLWLQIILYERFGHPFILQKQNDNHVKMVLKDSTSYLIFDQSEDVFFQTTIDMPCAAWESITEGWDSVLEKDLPAPGVNSLPPTLIEKFTFGFVIHYDLLGLIYWMLSRQEEIGRQDLDKFGRFPASSSHAYRHGYLSRPIVDEWLYVLGQVIQRTWPYLKLKDHKFSMKLSHDVDVPSAYGFKNWSIIARIMAGHLLKRGDLKQFYTAAIVRLNSSSRLHFDDPCNTFDWIMNISEEYGMKSAFYFICGRTNPVFDADYEPEHKAIRGLMREIHRRGHEIGLHPSYNTYQSPELIVKEAERLKEVCAEEGIEQSIWGGRMHYLRWAHPTTMHGWEAANMSYDSTLGYADHIGFRCGTCFEYPAFDPVKKMMLNLHIRPLIAMECTVMDDVYMGLGDTEAALERFIELKSTCARVGGCFTLLWHNSQFFSSARREIYKAVLST